MTKGPPPPERIQGSPHTANHSPSHEPRTDDTKARGSQMKSRLGRAVSGQGMTETESGFERPHQATRAATGMSVGRAQPLGASGCDHPCSGGALRPGHDRGRRIYVTQVDLDACGI